MALDYRSWIPTLFPAWLLAEWGAKFHEGMGAFVDAHLEGATQAARLRFPSEVMEEDLALIGQSFNIERYADESWASYAGRLQGAIAMWKTGGSALTLLQHIIASGYPDASLVEDYVRLSIFVLLHDADANPSRTLSQLGVIRRLAQKWRPAHVRLEAVSAPVTYTWAGSYYPQWPVTPLRHPLRWDDPILWGNTGTVIPGDP